MKAIVLSAGIVAMSATLGFSTADASPRKDWDRAGRVERDREVARNQGDAARGRRPDRVIVERRGRDRRPDRVIVERRRRDRRPDRVIVERRAPARRVTVHHRPGGPTRKVVIERRGGRIVKKVYIMPRGLHRELHHRRRMRAASRRPVVIGPRVIIHR